MNELTFKPIYHEDRIQTINPAGDVGVLTLWSKVEQVVQKLKSIDEDLIDPGKSRIAAISNLYGDGMFAMFCNLLHNPQIRYLIAVGQDLNLPTCAEIDAFIRDGLEDGKVLGKPMKRIKQTNRYFPAIPEFDESKLRTNLSFRYFGKLSTPNFAEEISRYFVDLPPRLETDAERIRVPMPEALTADYVYQPSDPIGHHVRRRRPLDCWEELIVRVMRFGRPITLRKGKRLELQNVKVLIAEPVAESAAALEKYGFSLEQFQNYQRKILDPVLPETIEYTYGNRLRGFFPQGSEGKDTLKTVIERLRDDPETRHGYISLWDTQRDLVHPDDDNDNAVPCLTALFFRRSENKLCLSATYRSHNLLTAWLENIYGLMAIQRYVAEEAGMPIGPMTVYSHSLGINPESSRFSYAQGLLEAWKSDDDFDRDAGKFVLRQDPNGHFTVTADEQNGKIIAQHYFEGVLVKRYEGRRPEDIEREVARDMSITVISHAMWLGRELARNEQLLKAAMKNNASQKSNAIPEEPAR